MKRILIMSICAICYISATSQQNNSITSRIAYIKDAYKKYTIDYRLNSHMYETKEIDFSYEYYNPILGLDDYYKDYSLEGSDGYGYKKRITRYYRKPDNILKKIEIYGMLDNNDTYTTQLVECYYDSSGIYFIYVRDSQSSLFDFDTRSFPTSEYRFYFDESGGCIKSLKKEYNCPSAESETLSQTIKNIEFNYLECSSLLLEIKTLIEKYKE
ncbi:MAG: hypothetical protein MJ069_09000 [Salinivirgaceae bacterium]|nr:hypothetical protein [Salinivirgaceae bacterium]